MMGKALAGELTCPCDRSCLAHLYECTGKAIAIPPSQHQLGVGVGVCGSSGSGVTVSTMLKIFTINFLCDGQGPDKLAIQDSLYMHRSC